MPVEAEILAARLTRIKTLIDALERTCLESEATRDTPDAETRTRSGPHLSPTRSTVQALAKGANERRFRGLLAPPFPCPFCKCRRLIRVGVVDDLGFFRCPDCDGLFTILRNPRAGDTDHHPHQET
jgi:hypothetical protein